MTTSIRFRMKKEGIGNGDRTRKSVSSKPMISMSGCLPVANGYDHFDTLPYDKGSRCKPTHSAIISHLKQKFKPFLKKISGKGKIVLKVLEKGGVWGGENFFQEVFPSPQKKYTLRKQL